MLDNEISFDQESSLEHFIPVDINDLISGLLTELDLPEEEKLLFKQFCKIFLALYHAHFFTKLQSLKHNYLPFSPDRTTLLLQTHSNEALQVMQGALIKEIKGIITKANYRPIGQEEVNQALSETSPYGLDLSIDFDDFDEIHLYYRGLASRTEQKRSWQTFFLTPETIEIPIYRRLFLVLKLKPTKKKAVSASFFSDPKAFVLDKWRQLFQMQMSQEGDNSVIYLKLFKDIPRADLEMLFPNTRVEMRRLDKVKIGVGGGGGVIGGIFTVVSKLARAAHPAAIVLAVASFMGLMWRQAGKVLSSRNRYLSALAKSLYFHNLDNNLGVLSNLIEMAEEEECKEAILAYGLLLHKQHQGCSADQLDRLIEDHLQKLYGVQVDFEMSDGIRKLSEAGLIEETPDHLIKPCSLKDALIRLDQEWDGMFSFEKCSA